MAIPRIPFTSPLPPAITRPPTATTLSAAISALITFLDSNGRSIGAQTKGRTLLLTGAGISVDSGLADYRGEKGTYRLNTQYRPIFFAEFVGRHEARKRYWARSFLGWPTVEKAKPNKAHAAIARLGEMGIIRGIITQNVDSLHHLAHPQLNLPHIASARELLFDDATPSTEQSLDPEIIEIHGTLRHLTCLSCSSRLPRKEFQSHLIQLNPTWADFLRSAQESGVFDPNNTREERIRTNPDGDVDIPGAPYTKFRYPPCPRCLEEGGVEVDHDGAHLPYPFYHKSGEQKVKGILKPSVVFFGESVQQGPRDAANRLVESCERILVIGSSLATYSAWKLVKEAANTGKGVGIINLGGVRGEVDFYEQADAQSLGPEKRLRLEFPAADMLAGAVEFLEGRKVDWREQIRQSLPAELPGLGG